MTDNDQLDVSSSSQEEKKRKGPSTRDLILYISQNAILAALYFVLTVYTQPISYGALQIRLAEGLGLLCFWRPDFAIGMTLGCFLANAYSFSPWDMLLGTLATLISCLCISYLSKWLWMACIYPVVINALVVGAELTWIYPWFDKFYLNAGWLALGELGAIAIGYAVWVALAHMKVFNKAFKPLRHQNVRW